MPKRIVYADDGTPKRHVDGAPVRIPAVAFTDAGAEARFAAAVLTLVEERDPDANAPLPPREAAP